METAMLIAMLVLNFQLERMIGWSKKLHAALQLGSPWPAPQRDRDAIPQVLPIESAKTPRITRRK